MIRENESLTGKKKKQASFCVSVFCMPRISLNWRISFLYFFSAKFLHDRKKRSRVFFCGKNLLFWRTRNCGRSKITVIANANLRSVKRRGDPDKKGSRASREEKAFNGVWWALNETKRKKKKKPLFFGAQSCFKCVETKADSVKPTKFVPLSTREKISGKTKIHARVVDERNMEA